MKTERNLISTLEKAFSAEDRFQTMYKILSDLLAAGYDRVTMVQNYVNLRMFWMMLEVNMTLIRLSIYSTVLSDGMGIGNYEIE